MTMAQQQIQDVMTKKIHAVRKDSTLSDVARMMHDQNIGNVIVTNPDGSFCGVVTDRDLVVRGIAAHRDPEKTPVSEVCTESVVKLPPTATLDEAVRLMRDRAVRRIPVVTDGKAIGIVSIGDLARAKDPDSALAQISSAAPNK
jgi:signal-transduction protein with cAMP-binding, CBS, and nucleotidyltransferase domain